MSRRKSPVLAALFKLTRAGVRQSARIGRAATRQGVEAGGKLAEQAGRVLSAVATPTDAPGAVAGGRSTRSLWRTLRRRSFSVKWFMASWRSGGRKG